MKEPYRLLVVDDQAIFRQGLTALLEHQPDLIVVGEAADGRQALLKARALRPDIILMDLKMPVCDGLEATALIRQELPEAKVIALTCLEDEPELVYQALTAGAVGYVAKTAGIEDLVVAIRAVARGEAAVTSPALTSLVAFLGRASTNPRASGDPAESVESLSAREQEVLELVAEGLSNREIADRLCISENTVHSHLRNILDKLHLANRVQAAAYAVGTRRDGSDRKGSAHPSPTGRPFHPTR